MVDRPIMFSAPMVQAILAGRKTQTRRLVKGIVDGARYQGRERDGMHLFTKGHVYGKLRGPAQPGDMLWVREAWRVGAKNDAVAPRDLDHPRGMTIAYEAGGSRAHETVGGPYVNSKASFTTAPWIGRLRASMHMPRWASRITLLCTDVRVERLNDCSEADAFAEGVELESADPPFYYVPGIWPHGLTAIGIEELRPRPAAACYAKLWDHINGEGAWAKNPLVWVYSFEKVEG